MDYPLYRVYNIPTRQENSTANPYAQNSVDYLSKQADHLENKFSFIPVSRLRPAGWKFKDIELVGEPDSILQ